MTIFANTGLKKVNPVYIPCISWSPRFMWCCIIKSVSGSYLRNYALGGRSNGVHSVDKHAKCLPTTNRIHQNTVHEKVSQDLWWPEPCEAIDIVLKALTILGFLPPSHWTSLSTTQNFKHAQNIGEQSRGHRRSLLGMLPSNGTPPQTAKRNKVCCGLEPQSKW